MATAKKTRKPWDAGGKAECPACWDEYGSLSCLRAAHGHRERYRDYPGTKVKITQDAEAPVEKEVLAAAILQISGAVLKLNKSGLNRKAVVALIKDDTGLGKGTVECVLASIQDLQKKYTK